MKKHISYPKILQFRNIVANVNRAITFTGIDENGDGIYDPSIPKPTLTFKGSVKLHGTNAGVCYNKKEGIWIQSRENIITTEKDNAGFAFFVESNKEKFKELFIQIIKENKDLNYAVDVLNHTISIFGEWAGGSIQKNVGISQLEKSFYIFAVKVSKIDDIDFKSYWLPSNNLRGKYNLIYNIEDFETFSVDVDFNMPQLSQNKFAELTEAVENECPVAKEFGIKNGLGEGIVWSCEINGDVHRFKVKGDKHSVSKVKTLASVDIEKLNSIKEFVEYSVTENRFQQAIGIIFLDNDLDVKKLGDLIRWVISDVTKEEMDTMVENKLEPKDVNKYISTKTREMFFTLQNENLNII